MAKEYRYEHRGYELVQTSYNWHYVILESQSGRTVAHSSCTVQLTEEEAKQHIENYLKQVFIEADVEVPSLERDVTGTPICPGHPKMCLGSGDFAPMFECCCDECDYLELCLEADKPTA